MKWPKVFATSIFLLILAWPVLAQEDCIPDGGTATFKSCVDITCCPGLACVDVPVPTVGTDFVSGALSEAMSSASCYKPKPGSALEPSGPAETKPVIFKPQVTIPGTITVGGKEIKFRQGEGVTVTSDTINQYLAVFYRFFIAGLAVIAVVMTMWGGFKRIMAAGSAERIKDANDTIFSALSGLILALVSYSLLQLINPKLVSLQPLQIEGIKKEALDWETEEQILATAKPNLVRLASDQHLWVATSTGYAEIDVAVRDALLRALNRLLPQGYSMQVTSAWRDPEKQKELIEQNCPDGAVKSKDCRPPTCLMLGGTTSCPHTTGRAIDVWGTKDGKVCLEAPQDTKLTGYCSGQGKGSCLENSCQKALIEAMRQEGFCLLCSEPWHFEIKDANGRGMSSCCN